MKDAAQEARIQAAYAAVPEHVREDLFEAVTWARETLTKREGSGHRFDLFAANDDLMCCAFAKPEWTGDHCGRAMEGGAEAVVMAVCEYINGA